jgi:hypothetical protein
VHCSYRTRIDQLAYVQQHRRLARLKAHHVNHSLVAGQIEERFGLFATARQWPFAVHVLAGSEGDFHKLLVLGHSYTDRYGVDIWVLRQPPRIVEYMLSPAALT